jgi:hypothetical protein
MASLDNGGDSFIVKRNLPPPDLYPSSFPSKIDD